MPTPRKLDPEGDQHGIVICNFRVTTDTLAKVKARATGKGCTVSDYLRALIAKDLLSE